LDINTTARGRKLFKAGRLGQQALQMKLSSSHDVERNTRREEGRDFERKRLGQQAMQMQLSSSRDVERNTPREAGSASREEGWDWRRG